MQYCNPAAISSKLGFSTAAFSKTAPFGANDIRMLSEVGIKRVEICGLRSPIHYDYHNRRRIEELKKDCQAHNVSIVSVHGPNVPYTSDYESVRRAAVEEAVLAARVAEELGAVVFVAHFGFSSCSEKTIREMLEQLDGTSIKLAVENGKSLPDFIGLADRINSNRFGIGVDIGHAQDADGINPFVKKKIARSTMEQCGQRLFHLHLHDFTDRDHQPPLTGRIQWGEVFAALSALGYNGELMFEPAYPSLEEVLTATARFPAAFVERYC